LSKNPTATFVRTKTRYDKEVIRVGVVDIIVAQVCVNCHNSRADTPKNDWKLGQIQGDVEIDTAINKQFGRGSAISGNLIIAIIVNVIGIAMTGITYLPVRAIALSIKPMAGVVGELADGTQILMSLAVATKINWVP